VTGLDLSSTRRPERARPWDLVLAVLAALALVAVVRGYFVSSAELERARHDRAQVEAQAAELGAKIQSLQGRSAPLLEMPLEQALPPLQVVGEIDALLPPDVRLLDLSLTYGKSPLVEMRIEALRAPSYDLFLERLQASRTFRSIVPGAETRDGQVSGSVRAEFGPRR
jgi:hypothetical protein